MVQFVTDTFGNVIRIKLHTKWLDLFGSFKDKEWNVGLVEEKRQSEATDTTTRNQDIRLADSFDLLRSEISLGPTMRVRSQLDVGMHGRGILYAWQWHKCASGLEYCGHNFGL